MSLRTNLTATLFVFRIAASESVRSLRRDVQIVAGAYPATFSSAPIRFQVVVLSAYKQMRAQTADVLSDIDEDDYDMAFTFSRPGQQSSDEHKAVEEESAPLDRHKGLIDVAAPLVDSKTFEGAQG
ncbi:hypothetical protein F5880DRAFT_1512643 [Lentinula raphanica]|nr:hypothetical protein F5880DRAFT_1512643 [Lentinula raphanica]